jgi:hypothetical protein
MKNKEKSPEKGVEKWANEVLGSIDGIKRAPANPFLYTKIVAGIETKSAPWETAASWLSRPAFAFASVLLFLAVNIAVVMWGNNKANNELAKKLASEQMLASEFMNTQNYQLVDINE